MNVVTLAGKVVGTPVFTKSETNNHLLKFSISDDHKWTQRETNLAKTKSFRHDVIVWGQHGKELNESGLAEGDVVVVLGRLDYHAFKDPERGGKESKKSQINARQVDVISKAQAQ